MYQSTAPHATISTSTADERVTPSDMLHTQRMPLHSSTRSSLTARFGFVEPAHHVQNRKEHTRAALVTRLARRFSALGSRILMLI